MGNAFRGWVVIAAACALLGCGSDEARAPQPVRELRLDPVQPAIADGTAEIVLSWQVLEDGAPVEGIPAVFSLTGTNQVRGAIAPTNAEGRSSAAIASTEAGTKSAVVKVRVGQTELEASAELRFDPGPAVGLTFSTPPADADAGVPLPNFVVRGADRYGNETSLGPRSVNLTLTFDGFAELFEGPRSASAGDAGGAVFSGLVITYAGNGFAFIASAEGLGETESPTFEVRPAAAAWMEISHQPLTTSSPISELGVALFDRYENPITRPQAVTLSIASGPPGATLSGDTTREFIGGQATFFDVTLSPAGEYVLKLSSEGVPELLTEPIEVL